LTSYDFFADCSSMSLICRIIARLRNPISIGLLMVFVLILSSRMLVAAEANGDLAAVAETASTTATPWPQPPETSVETDPVVVSQRIPPALAIGRIKALGPVVQPQAFTPEKMETATVAAEARGPSTITIAPRETLPEKISRPRSGRVDQRRTNEAQDGADTAASTEHRDASAAAEKNGRKNPSDGETVSLPPKTTVVMLPVRMGPITSREVSDKVQPQQSGPEAGLALIHNHRQPLAGGMIDSTVFAATDDVPGRPVAPHPFDFVGTIIDIPQRATAVAMLSANASVDAAAMIEPEAGESSFAGVANQLLKGHLPPVAVLAPETTLARAGMLEVEDESSPTKPETDNSTSLPPQFLPILIDDQLVSVDDGPSNGESAVATVPQMASPEHLPQSPPPSPLDYTLPGGGLDIFKLAPSRFSVPLPMAAPVTAPH